LCDDSRKPEGRELMKLALARARGKRGADVRPDFLEAAASRHDGLSLGFAIRLHGGYDRHRGIL
jgi:hypothetical protein